MGIKDQMFIKDGGSSKAQIGYTQEDYKNALGTTAPTDTGNSRTDYYNALKNESYKTLLNSEVQASIARDQAMKYTNNSLRAQGYANQGLAESTNLGLQSQYQTALANARNNYQQSIQGINEQQRNEIIAQQNDDFQSITTLMSGATDTNQLNDIISTMGYGDLNNGQMDWTKLESSNLDERSKKQLKALYAMYNSQLAGSSTNAMTSLEALNSGTYIANNDGNKVKSLGEYFGEEIKFLWHKGSTGEYTNGETIKVNNGNGDTIYLQWVGNGFKMVSPTKADHTLTWTGSSNKYQ